MRTRSRGRGRRIFTPALVVSGALHSAALGAALLPWGSDRPGVPRAATVVLVELPPPRDTTEATARLSSADPPDGHLPAAPELMRRVETLAGEKSELSERLADERRRTAQLEAHYRQEIAALETAKSHLGEEIAALAADRSALAAEVEAERRQNTALENELARRREVEQAAQDELAATYDRLVRALSREIADSDVAIERANEQLTVAIVDLVLFPSGRAELTPAGEGIIDRVGAALRAVTRRPILVEGHTDDVPIGPALAIRFPSNWELSTARATGVVKRLIDHGDVAAQRLRAVGRAETEPVASNDTEDGRRRNRRIEVILVPPALAPSDAS